MAEEAPVRPASEHLRPEPRYALAAGLRQRAWPGESTEVVYLPLTRSTLLVDDAAGALLHLLAELGGTATAGELLAALAQAGVPAEAASPDDDLQAIVVQLQQLADHGLVQAL